MTGNPAGIPKDADQLAPGVYAFRGELHIDANELCAHAGVPVTERNVNALVAAAFDVAGREGIPVEIRERRQR